MCGLNGNPSIDLHCHLYNIIILLQPCNTNTHTHNRFTALLDMSGMTRVSRYQKGKTSQVKTNLNLLEQVTVSGSGICWAICKVCTSSQTTTPTSHHSVFYRPDALPAAQPTASKHWRKPCKCVINKNKLMIVITVELYSRFLSVIPNALHELITEKFWGGI